MARSFRYYGKKRGHRRTGSSTWGSVGEAAFWAALLLLGFLGTVVLIFNFVVPAWRVNHEFRTTSCKVLNKRIAEKPSEDGPLYRPEFQIEYQIDGAAYRGWHFDIHRHNVNGGYSAGRDNAQAALDRFDLYDAARDNRYPCWYDPANHGVVVLERGYQWWLWLVFTVPLSFVVIGVGGLVYTILHWGKSVERRAALAQRGQDRNLFGGNGGDRTYPFVPAGADTTNSPGTKLRFRLPMARSPAWALFGTLALCLALNGVVAVYAAIAVNNHLSGRPDWSLTLFVLPFASIGLGTIAIFVRQVLRATGVGPTLVEISDHPIHCGGQYRLFLSQSGSLKLEHVRLEVACEETATYRQGTNTRTETQAVYCRELLHGENIAIRSGQPFEFELELSVPARAMHSLKTGHNEINWALNVSGEVAGWRPNFKRSFPLVVRPANGNVGR